MRLSIKLASEKEYISLTLHHSPIVQGMLYKSLPSYLSKFLHDIGFFYNGRKFKLFTFSKIMSEHFIIQKDRKKIKYKTPITLYISSGIDDISKSWGENFIKRDKITLGKNQLYIEAIEVLPKPKFSEEITVKTLSPITAYQTVHSNGKKFYKYYSPQDKEFETLLKENIKKKYYILKNKKIEDFSFEIKSINIRKARIKYKDFLIEAYDGTFKIKTDPEIFKTVYDPGLPAKNSQGFGMVEVMNSE